MIYVVLFKSVNVGGKNIIKMEILRELLNDMGMQNVKTYVQSGNVVLSSDLPKDELKQLIEEECSVSFGFDIKVAIRTQDEMRGLIEGFPFSAEDVKKFISYDPDVEHVYVYFFIGSLIEEVLSDIIDHTSEDRIHWNEEVLYLLCKQSIADSKLAALISKKKHHLL